MVQKNHAAIKDLQEARAQEMQEVKDLVEQIEGNSVSIAKLQDSNQTALAGKMNDRMEHIEQTALSIAQAQDQKIEVTKQALLNEVQHLHSELEGLRSVSERQVKSVLDQVMALKASAKAVTV